MCSNFGEKTVGKGTLSQAIETNRLGKASSLASKLAKLPSKG